MAKRCGIGNPGYPAKSKNTSFPKGNTTSDAAKYQGSAIADRDGNKMHNHLDQLKMFPGVRRMSTERKLVGGNMKVKAGAGPFDKD